MGGTFPLITLLVVAVLGRHVVSANDCFISNCEFAVREECQTSESVICSMRYRPNKQINITKASFPRGVQDIKISDAETLTIGEDSISSLTFLEVIEITNVNTLILKPRSLARGGKSERITVTIRAVTSLQIHSETLAGWRGESRITIEDVDDCQMFQHSIAKAQLKSLIFNRIQSMVINEAVFGNNTRIHNIRINNITSLFISKEAFTANVAVNKSCFVDVKQLTICSGAIAKNSRIQEALIRNVPNLIIDSSGIEAEIKELKLHNVTMETCDKKAFGGKVGSLSLRWSHIHRTRKNCISANNGMNKLIIESSRLNRIETSGIYGTVREVQIKDSTIGTIAKEGLQLNVTKFSIENSTIKEASEKTFVVLADSDITIRKCTIDTLQKDAFGLLKVTQGSDLAHHRIQLDNLHIKHPQHGSLLFDKNQRVIVHELKTDTPCECNITLTLGLDMSSEHTFWIQQPLCVIKGVLPTLGRYLKDFCTEPITTPLPANPITNPANFIREGTTPLPPQTAGESNDQDQQTIPETSDQTSGDSSDQVRTGFTHNVELIVTISVIVGLIALVVMLALLVYRKRWQRRRISRTVKKYHTYQSLPDIRQMTRGFSHHVYDMPLPPPPPTEAVEIRDFGQEEDDDEIYETVEAHYQEIAEGHQQMEQGGTATIELASLTRPSPCHYHRLNPTQHQHHCLKSTTHYDHLIHPP